MFVEKKYAERECGKKERKNEREWIVRGRDSENYHCRLK
jgi:hypothetical protein